MVTLFSLPEEMQVLPLIYVGSWKDRDGVLRSGYQGPLNGCAEDYAEAGKPVPYLHDQLDHKVEARHFKARDG